MVRYLPLLLVMACNPVHSDEPDSGSSGLSDGALADAAAPPDATSCQPSTFLRCDGHVLVTCNAQGNDTVMTDCGAPGCNLDRMECNECPPGGTQCRGDILQLCNSEGLVTAESACLGGCADSNGTVGAHCFRVRPSYLGVDACTMPAAGSLDVANGNLTIDTSLPSTCSSVQTQSGGAEICVLRATTMKVATGKVLTFMGTRAVALVVDGDVDLSGTIDASASGTSDGPGAPAAAGVPPSCSTIGAGGGGGGHGTVGGAGGNDGATGAGNPGGAAYDLTDGEAILQGGARGAVCLGGQGGAGGGGGALLIASCAGAINMSGVADVGGGGGPGGGGSATGGLSTGGTGGGGGSRVHLQAFKVTLNSAGLFANGGGGGGGGEHAAQPGVVGASGQPGADADRSFNAAIGGLGGANLGGRGGAGGTRTVMAQPGSGAATAAHGDGGGGGAVGRIQIDVRSGTTVVKTGIVRVSPPETGGAVPAN